jgi:hypothetical protein
MRILHILRSEPDEMTRDFIRVTSQGKDHGEIILYRGDLDYGRLVEDIFKSDQVICWW